MSELIEGRIVTVRKLDASKLEMGLIKKVMGKLVVTIKRNNKLINLSQDVLSEFYEVMCTSEKEVTY